MPNVAMYGKADWNSGFIKIINNTSAEVAQVIADEDPNITFFFFARQGMYLPPLSKEPRFQNGQFQLEMLFSSKGGHDGALHLNAMPTRNLQDNHFIKREVQSM